MRVVPHKDVTSKLGKNMTKTLKLPGYESLMTLIYFLSGDFDTSCLVYSSGSTYKSLVGRNTES